ncbi:MAG: hypothetical protein R2724_17050 [Bryobacterales bacterium]
MNKAISALAHSGVVKNGIAPNALNGISDAMLQGMFNVKGATAALAGLIGGPKSSPRSFADLMTRVRLLHLLHDALDKAQKPGGNPQTQINDLIIKLQNLSRDSSEAQGMSPTKRSRRFRR